ncbi:iron ABC transporter permease [Brevibacterium oceani]|uniref:iron ABC transporter permease n=1 Tax=Brevibacterium oceani TaxID=358099 RepID=UPI001FE3ADCA|nr:iron ABC transporter permease [Brevibacterium oceani]
MKQSATGRTAPSPAASAEVRTSPRGSAASVTATLGVTVCLVLALAAAALWHLAQGTSGVGLGDIVRALIGEVGRLGDPDSGSSGAAVPSVNGVPVADIFAGSRLPRLAAGVAVGLALGVAGCLLQSITRNPLASPDTLAVASGSHFALTVLAAAGLTLPLWASSAVASTGGLTAALCVLGLAGRAATKETTRIILAGSAIAMALEAGTGMMLLLFKENTVGLYAWGSGSLSQLNLDGSLRAAPVIALALIAALLLSRRLDVLGIGEDAAASLGIPVRMTRLAAVVLAVVLTAVSVTLAGPIAFVGLGAPVLTRLLAHVVPALHRHMLALPVAGLIGALLIIVADACVRAVLSPTGAASIPTGIPTSLLGGALIVVLAMRLRDSASAGQAASVTGRLRSSRRFVIVLSVATGCLIAVVAIGLLAGSLWLRLGDVALWLSHDAPALIDRAFNERVPRILAACLAGAGLGLAGCLVQSTVRNPLAEPGILGITAGAGLGGAVAVTLLGGSRPLLVTAAVLAGLITFAIVAGLAWRGGFRPDRFVLIGIGMGYVLSAVTTFLLLSVDPWKTPRLFTWLSGTTYGRVDLDSLPIGLVLLAAIPLAFVMSRTLDLLALDDDTPRLLGVRTARTRLIALTLAAVLAAASVIAVGVVGFVGLIAPHFARFLVGSQHRRVIPTTVLIGAVIVCAADTIGRTVISPAQIPAGLMIALIGAPYFVWLLRRSRA